MSTDQQQVTENNNVQATTSEETGAGALDVYFAYTRRLSEMVFQAKLQLYEEASVSVMEEITAARMLDATGGDGAAAASSVDATVDASAPARRTEFLDAADQFVDMVYSDLPTGFDCVPPIAEFMKMPGAAAAAAAPAAGGGAAASEEEEQPQQRFDPFLYGELEPAGVRQVAALVKAAVAKHNNSNNRNNNDETTTSSSSLSEAVFVDLGSGIGKAVIDLVMVCNDSSSSSASSDDVVVIRGVGVELEPRRAQVADAALDCLTQVRAASPLAECAASRVRFVNADMLSDRRLFCSPSSPAASSPTTRSTTGVFAFCCGVAFSKDMCASILGAVLGVESSNNDDDANNNDNNLKLLGGLFLFREWPFAELSLPEDLAAAAGGGGWVVTKISVAASWMSEAPAFLLAKA